MAVKKDDRISLCGDSEATVNPTPRLEKHRMPRIEDLGHALSANEKLTKFDFKDCKERVILAEESRKYFTISTRIGLFQYTRLHSGLYPATAIFRHEMGNLFGGLAHVTVYCDDLLLARFRVHRECELCSQPTS